MSLSNAAAAQCLAQYGARSVTDVTGFGLAGHLYETIGDDPLRARLHLDRLPVLPGAIELLGRGWESSLHGANHRWVAASLQSEDAAPILFDPQTAGPLIASLPAERAADCVAALQQCGNPDAAIVGEIERRELTDPVKIRCESG